MPPSPRCFLSSLLLGAALALGAGCSPRPPTLTFTLTQAELQQPVAERFPVTKEKLFASVTFRDPRVILREGDPRIGLDLEVEAKVPVVSPIKGRIAALGEIAYDPATRHFYFRNPEVEKLQFPGLPGDVREMAAAAVEDVAAPVLENTPVYTLKDRNLEERTAGYLLRDVSVKDGRLHLTLGLPEGEASAVHTSILFWVIGLGSFALLIGVLFLRVRKRPTHP